MAQHRDTMVSAQYFTAVAGFAALRHCLTRPSDVRDRLEELKRIVAGIDEFPNNIEIPVSQHTADDGYTRWAPSYDDPNPAIEAEEPVFHEILDRAPRGRAVDVACGTGRHAVHLAELGYEVVGVDPNEAMLDVARAKASTVNFVPGRFDALPAPDNSVDLVTCSLALTHTEDLATAVAEFARVLRPGGWAVLSDMHPVTVLLGGAAIFRDHDAASNGMTLPHVPNLHHPIERYIRAFTAAQLTIAECREVEMPQSGIEMNPAYAVLPDAVRQAFSGTPFVLIWRLTKP